MQGCGFAHLDVECDCSSPLRPGTRHCFSALQRPKGPSPGRWNGKQSCGTYALLLELEQPAGITIGRLGTSFFPAGYYVYVGSALGSGGLAARLARHGRQNKKLHWHIDYFLVHARIVGIDTDDSGQRLECAWARTMLSRPGAQVVAPRFGASDCTCPSHLIYWGASDPSE